jgi:hypothetical protein
MTLRLVQAAILVRLFLLAAGQAVAQDAPPPPRKIPGITTEDQFAQACVGCHVNRTDIGLDVRLSTLMKQWYTEVPAPLLEKARAAASAGATLKGKHPVVAASLQDIPGGCLRCHAKTSKTAPPFAQLLHAVHLTGGAENPFLTFFQGECTHCHKLDRATGTWSIPSGPEPAP